jgi:hypothetical protein
MSTTTPAQQQMEHFFVPNLYQQTTAHFNANGVESVR